MEIFLTYIDKGGFIFTFLFFLSIITIAIVIFKYTEIYIFRKLDFSNFLKDIDIIKENEKITLTKIINLINDLSPSSKKNLLVKIVNVFNLNQSESFVEQEINRIFEIEFKKIQSLMPSLEIISQVSPLIGLLGTVIGMIDSFNELELGGGLVDPSILAGGIWTALLTTAMGLVVAIPALVSHYFLEKKISNLHTNLEALLNKLSVIK